uniref:Uncharacterized protein n=1 Tax=Dicentrarchus labrax TaxID=13489 RepID=A0A8P4KNI3_DICLA
PPYTQLLPLPASSCRPAALLPVCSSGPIGSRQLAVQPAASVQRGGRASEDPGGENPERHPRRARRHRQHAGNHRSDSLQLVSDWLLSSSSSSCVSNVVLSSSGFDPRPLDSDSKPAGDDAITENPCGARPQTAIRALHTGQSVSRLTCLTCCYLLLPVSPVSPVVTCLTCLTCCYLSHLSHLLLPVCRPLQEMSVSRMCAGSRLYQRLLGVLSDRLSGLSDLRADLRDLLTHINKMREAAQLGAGGGVDQDHGLDLTSRSDYDVQVAVHLTLTQLRSFCHDLIRSLRAVATYRPRAAGAL